MRFLATLFRNVSRHGAVERDLDEEVRAHFNEKELADLTFAISTINAWNRLSISARLTPGTYSPLPAARGEG